jgi:hypothetical protein
MGAYGFRNNKLAIENLEADKLVVPTDDFVVSYSIPRISTVSTGSILSGWDTTSTTARTGTALAIQPPYPVKIGVLANAAGSAGGSDTITIVGPDAQGKVVSEAVAVQATAAGLNYSNNAFARITSLTPANAAGIAPKSDSVGLQFGTALGMPYPITNSASILTFNYKGTQATTSLSDVTVVGTYDTIAIPLSEAGAEVFFLYKTKLQK